MGCGSREKIVKLHSKLTQMSLINISFSTVCPSTHNINSELSDLPGCPHEPPLTAPSNFQGPAGHHPHLAWSYCCSASCCSFSASSGLRLPGHMLLEGMALGVQEGMTRYLEPNRYFINIFSLSQLIFIFCGLLHSQCFG